MFDYKDNFPNLYNLEVVYSLIVTKSIPNSKIKLFCDFVNYYLEVELIPH